MHPRNHTQHLVVFDPTTGKVVNKSSTPQGYSVNSTWARGQAWAIYGFTMAYRYTQNPVYLRYALNVSLYWARHVPADGVPLWDFDAPTAEAYRDTSAAAIAACGLLELFEYTGARELRSLANTTLASLGAAPYLADPDLTDAVLDYNAHDCGSNACTVIEADYFFFEALRRAEKMRLWDHNNE
jgi:unsaturated chondroitin disaccharide hydrolase